VRTPLIKPDHHTTNNHTTGPDHHKNKTTPLPQVNSQLTMIAAREERRRNRSRIDYTDWEGDEGGMDDDDEGGGKLEDPYDGHLNAEELSRSLLDLVTLYERAAQAQVGALAWCWVSLGLVGGVGRLCIVQCI